MISKSTRRSAIKFNPDWAARHRNREAVANKPGCRGYAKGWAGRHGLRVRYGHVWSFRKSIRKPALAIWTPYSAKLRFPTLGEVVHVHDVLAVCHEIENRSGLLGLRTSQGHGRPG